MFYVVLNDVDNIVNVKSELWTIEWLWALGCELYDVMNYVGFILYVCYEYCFMLYVMNIVSFIQRIKPLEAYLVPALARIASVVENNRWKGVTPWIWGYKISFLIFTKFRCYSLLYRFSSLFFLNNGELIYYIIGIYKLLA
jgi:hypothetical protein